jgi:hypothetical protein
MVTGDADRLPDELAAPLEDAQRRSADVRHGNSGQWTVGHRNRQRQRAVCVTCGSSVLPQETLEEESRPQQGRRPKFANSWSASPLASKCGTLYRPSKVGTRSVSPKKGAAAERQRLPAASATLLN